MNYVRRDKLVTETSDSGDEPQMNYRRGTYADYEGETN